MLNKQATAKTVACFVCNYVFRNSHEISMKTGLIGHLRADIGKFGREFWHTWWSFREELNTPEFKDFLWNIIYNLRAEGGFFVQSHYA